MVLSLYYQSLCFEELMILRGKWLYTFLTAYAGDYFWVKVWMLNWEIIFWMKVLNFSYSSHTTHMACRFVEMKNNSGNVLSYTIFYDLFLFICPNIVIWFELFPRKKLDSTLKSHVMLSKIKLTIECNSFAAFIPRNNSFDIELSFVRVNNASLLWLHDKMQYHLPHKCKKLC